MKFSNGIVTIGLVALLSGCAGIMPCSRNQIYEKKVDINGDGIKDRVYAVYDSECNISNKMRESYTSNAWMLNKHGRGEELILPTYTLMVEYGGIDNPAKELAFFVEAFPSRIDFVDSDGNGVKELDYEF